MDDKMKNCETFLDHFDLEIPLCVDLDGTLIQEDVTTLSVKGFLKKSPHLFWKLLIWIAQGRAVCKQNLAASTKVPVETLTFNKGLLEILIQEKSKGRSIILATAADQGQAQEIEAHLNLFNQIIASDGCTNRRAHAKADILLRTFPKTGFLYAGNSADDLHVWSVAKGALCVNTPEKVLKKVPKLNIPYFVSPTPFH
jgi:hypothetical protein